MTNWLGTVVGGAAGFLVGGPFGAVAGAGLGQAWDRGWLGKPAPAPLKVGQELSALFELLGHLARADGRVSEREVAFAEALMDRFKLAGTERKRAVAAFDRGRQEGFAIDEPLARLAAINAPGSAEAHQLVDLLVRLAEADGALVPAERGALGRIAHQLGVASGTTRAVKQLTGWSVDKARSELGVDARADDTEIRAAYKRLLSRYHPDKLAGQNLSETELAQAQQRLQQVRDAYEFLRLRKS